MKSYYYENEITVKSGKREKSQFYCCLVPCKFLMFEIYLLILGHPNMYVCPVPPVPICPFPVSKKVMEQGKFVKKSSEMVQG